MFINIVRWRVKKEDSAKQHEIWSEMMKYQKSHPEKVYYTRSRFFTYTNKESSEENWMFLDEYEDREGFDKWMKASNEDPELLKLEDDFFPKWNPLIVSGSRKTEVWSEAEELRVELK